MLRRGGIRRSEWGMGDEATDPGRERRRRLTEYRIVYGTRVIYDYTRLSLGLELISLNVQRT